jgi:DnaK suppressor protein
VVQEDRMTETTTRNTDLRQMLEGRRRELQDDVQTHIRDGRSDQGSEVRDLIELSDDHVRGDIEFALLQMRGETLIRIDQALARLDADTYGSCAACGEPIAERRLRVLPFAVRCQSCESARETREHARQLSSRRAGFSLFPETV